jgi:hypothetical protein
MPVRLFLQALLLVTAGLVAQAVAGTEGDPELFPGAVPDAREMAALAQPGGIGPRVLRTPAPFEIVLSYYRFKRKQAVHVTREQPADRLRAIASALERADGAAALRAEPMIARFHRVRFGRVDVDPQEAARAWRAYAARLDGQVQLVGEGERVTLYRPYLSQCTFDLIDETIIILRTDGGQRHESTNSTRSGDCRLPGGADNRGAGSER